MEILGTFVYNKTYIPKNHNGITIAVVTESIAIFKDYVKNNSDKENQYIIVEDLDDIRGRHFDYFIIINHSRANEIINYLKAREVKEYIK